MTCRTPAEMCILVMTFHEGKSHCVHAATNRSCGPCGDGFGKVHRLVSGRVGPGASLRGGMGRFSRHVMRRLDLCRPLPAACGGVVSPEQRLGAAGDAPSGVSRDV